MVQLRGLLCATSLDVLVEVVEASNGCPGLTEIPMNHHYATHSYLVLVLVMVLFVVLQAAVVVAVDSSLRNYILVYLAHNRTVHCLAVKDHYPQSNSSLYPYD